MGNLCGCPFGLEVFSVLLVLLILVVLIVLLVLIVVLLILLVVLLVLVIVFHFKNSSFIIVYARFTFIMRINTINIC